MTQNEINEWLHREPFQSFTLVLSTNERFTIRAREFAWVDWSRCRIGLFDPLDLHRTTDIALSHIVRIEPQQAPAAAAESTLTMQE